MSVGGGVGVELGGGCGATPSRAIASQSGREWPIFKCALRGFDDLRRRLRVVQDTLVLRGSGVLCDNNPDVAVGIKVYAVAKVAGVREAET